MKEWNCVRSIPIPDTCDRIEAMHGFLGFTLSKGSNTWGITIFPTFLLSSGSAFTLRTLYSMIKAHCYKHSVKEKRTCLFEPRCRQPSIPPWVGKMSTWQDDGNWLNMCMHRLGNPDMVAPVLCATQGVDLREGGSSSLRNDTVKGLSQGAKCYCKVPLIRWKIFAKVLFKW